MAAEKGRCWINIKPFNLELDDATFPLCYSTKSRAKIRGKVLLKQRKGIIYLKILVGFQI